MNIERLAAVALAALAVAHAHQALAGVPAVSALLTGNPTALAQAPLLTKDFGGVAVGGSIAGAQETLTVTVSPTDGGVVDITGISASGDFSVTGGTCVNATGLADGSTCTLDLQFSPSAPGTRNGVLSIACRVATAAIGVIGLVCVDAPLQAFNLTGLGILADVARGIPTLGREALTLTALLLFVGGLLTLRRRR